MQESAQQDQPVEHFLAYYQIAKNYDRPNTHDQTLLNFKTAEDELLINPIIFSSTIKIVCNLRSL